MIRSYTTQDYKKYIKYPLLNWWSFCQEVSSLSVNRNLAPLPLAPQWRISNMTTNVT